MKIAIMTDEHADGKNLGDLDAQSSAAAAICSDHGIDLILHGGDMFHKAKIHDEPASTGGILEAAHRALAKFTGTNHIILLGNHDKAGVGQPDALHAFDGSPNVKVIRKPSVETYGGANIFCLPWSWEGQSAEHAFDAFNLPASVDVFLGHVEVIGGRMNDFCTCKSTPGQWQISRTCLDGIKAKHIAIGHFHKRQQLNPRGGYIGSFMQHTFNGTGDPAGFEIYDTVTGETQWIELEAARKHCIFVVDENTPAPESLPEHAKSMIKYSRGICDQVEARRLENAGAVIKEFVERVERIKRADVPAGALEDPHGLIGLYAASQNPPLAGDRLERMHDTFGDLTGAERADGVDVKDLII